MKKILLLTLFILFSPLLSAEEKILNFAVTLSLDTNAKAEITEEITLNVEHKNIRRGIIRELPQNSGQKISVKSLSMDGQYHPYFIEKPAGKIEVNFGDDDFIPKGEHTYKLVYTMENAVIFTPEYDEIYWNVTGNDWQFKIDNASFNLILPEGHSVITRGISMYVGKYGQKLRLAKQTGHLSFQTVRPLGIGEGFTVAVPFEKGLIKQSFDEQAANTDFASSNLASNNYVNTDFEAMRGLTANQITPQHHQAASRSTTSTRTPNAPIKTTRPPRGVNYNNNSIPLSELNGILDEILPPFFRDQSIPKLLAAILFIYCLITWFLFGKDPKPDGRVLYAPPAGVSPAFIRYIKNRSFDLTSFATILIALSLKNKIKINRIKIGFFKFLTLTRIDSNTEGLEEEEKFILNKLFNNSFSGSGGVVEMINLLRDKIPNAESFLPSKETLDKDAVFLGGRYNPQIEYIFNSARHMIQEKGKKLVSKNGFLIIIPILLMLGMLPFFSFANLMTNIFILIFILPSISKSAGKKISLIIPIVILFLLSKKLGTNFLETKEIIFMVSAVIFMFYKATISNTTQQGKLLYLDTLAFETYMESAEKGRVALSNPQDNAKIFADFLPYAYALGLQSKWLKTFKKVLSADLINMKMDAFGGEEIITGSIFSSVLETATQRPSSKSGGSSGSFGRGSSGGGFGGGGGRGR